VVVSAGLRTEAAATFRFSSEALDYETEHPTIRSTGTMIGHAR
jgi:hypothetical protein